MTANEFQDWRAYFLVQPFGNPAADFRAGVIAATIANVFGSKKASRIKPMDFFPEYQPHRQTWEDQLIIVEMLNSAFGGKDLRKRAG